MKPVSIVVREDAMVPLDRWLASELSRLLGRVVPRGLVRRAIVGGTISVGGRVARDPAMIPRRGPSVFVRNFDWLPEPDRGARLRVLYEDEWVIVVDKPPGLPTHESKDPGRPSLAEAVEAHLGRRAMVHQRLDAGTSGVVLFAKAPEANPSLAKSFAEGEVEKTYVALVARPPVDWPSELAIDTPILIAANGAVRVDRSGVPAHTRIRVLDRRDRTLLVEARPMTGRKHQIRVHLASVGAPIVGDTRYGGPRSVDHRLMLHAERIQLAHPVTRARLSVTSPRPGEFLPRALPVSRTTGPGRRGRGPSPGRAGDGPKPRGGPPGERGLRTRRTRRRLPAGRARGSRR